MLNRIFSRGFTSLYGVPPPGHSPVDILIAILKFAILPIVIPVLLTVGVLVLMKKKAYPVKKRVLAVVIMLIVYFALLAAAGFLFVWV